MLGSKLKKKILLPPRVSYPICWRRDNDISRDNEISLFVHFVARGETSLLVFCIRAFPPPVHMFSPMLGPKWREKNFKLQQMRHFFFPFYRTNLHNRNGRKEEIFILQLKKRLEV